MMRYQVADVSVDGCLALLLDTDEFVHVVRLPVGRLERGAILSGRRAKLGAHVLVELGQRMALHAKFVSVACSQDDALSLVHPAGKGSSDAPTKPSKPGTGETHEFA